jgi:hypothetical protein
MFTKTAEGAHCLPDGQRRFAGESLAIFALLAVISPAMPGDSAMDPRESIFSLLQQESENHVAQTVLFAVCGFSRPNWPQAADLPGKQEVCATPSQV